MIHRLPSLEDGLRDRLSLLVFLYGLPNSFPDDPAVQVTSSRSTAALGELDVARAEDVLKKPELNQ